MRFNAILSLLMVATSLCLRESSGAETNQNDVARNTNAVRIIVQPMAHNPAKWDVGKRLTVMVTCESDDGPTRVLGIATDVELVATKTYDNRWEMMLRSTHESIAKIRAAADLSEYWFTVTPFKESHRKQVAESPDIVQFLEKNKQYRPADGTNWGLNARSQERLRVPSKDELPRRVKIAKPTDQREPE